MTPRRWIAFIIVNIVVSAVTVLIVLNVWETSHPVPRAAIPTIVATLDATAQTRVAATAAAPTRTPTTANVQKYTVQPGDTLSGIARKFDVSVNDIKDLNNLTNPDILSDGQELVIPGSPLTPTPTRVPIPTSTHVPLPVITGTAFTAVGDYFVTIREIKAVGSLSDELATLTNLSGTVNMAGWTMSDGEGNQFTFPRLLLLSKGEVTVHTGKGTDTATDLYWGQTEPRWASGKVAYLRDPDGKLVTSYLVP